MVKIVKEQYFSCLQNIMIIQNQLYKSQKNHCQRHGEGMYETRLEAKQYMVRSSRLTTTRGLHTNDRALETYKHDTVLRPRRNACIRVVQYFRRTKVTWESLPRPRETRSRGGEGPRSMVQQHPSTDEIEGVVHSQPVLRTRTPKRVR